MGLVLQDNPPDYEQFLPGLFPDVTYEDLYVMGAQDRQQVQVVNEFDPCCHNYDAYPLYEQAVRQMLGETGQFAVYLDVGESTHHISPDALALMLDMIG